MASEGKRMRMAKALTGIDIGTGHLKMAVCDGRAVSQVIVEDMPDNLVKDGRITSLETMSELLRNTVRKHRVSAKNAAFVLNSRDVYTRRIVLPAMTVDELKLNLPFEFRDYIADGKDKYRFDYALLEMRYDEAGVPQEMDVLAVAAPIETIEGYADMLRRAGLKLKIAAPDIMAYANIIAQYERNHPVVDAVNQGSSGGFPSAEAGVAPAAAQVAAPAQAAPASAPRDFCFLDIGSSNTRVYLFPHGKYEVTRSVEFGVHSLVAAVADHFGVDENLAKTYVATNYENAQTIQPCLDLYERIGVELARIVSFFNFNYPDSQLATVHFCGSGSGIAPLLHAIDEHLSIDLVDIGAMMPYSPAVADSLRACPAAVGLALQ